MEPLKGHGEEMRFCVLSCPENLHVCLKNVLRSHEHKVSQGNTKHLLENPILFFLPAHIFFFPPPYHLRGSVEIIILLFLSTICPVCNFVKWCLQTADST